MSFDFDKNINIIDDCPIKTMTLMINLHLLVIPIKDKTNEFINAILDSKIIAPRILDKTELKLEYSSINFKIRIWSFNELKNIIHALYCLNDILSTSLTITYIKDAQNTLKFDTLDLRVFDNIQKHSLAPWDITFKNFNFEHVYNIHSFSSGYYCKLKYCVINYLHTPFHVNHNDNTIRNLILEEV